MEFLDLIALSFMAIIAWIAFKGGLIPAFFASIKMVLFLIGFGNYGPVISAYLVKTWQLGELFSLGLGGLILPQATNQGFVLNSNLVLSPGVISVHLQESLAEIGITPFFQRILINGLTSDILKSLQQQLNLHDNEHLIVNYLGYALAFLVVLIFSGALIYALAAIISGVGKNLINLALGQPQKSKIYFLHGIVASGIRSVLALVNIFLFCILLQPIFSFFTLDFKLPPILAYIFDLSWFVENWMIEMLGKFFDGGLY